MQDQEFLKKVLKSLFLKLVEKHSSSQLLATKLWNEIDAAYGRKNRIYHNLEHLSHLVKTLTPLKSEINDWDTLCFSIFYHDIIYNVRRADNEEKSAELAVERLQELNYPTEKIETCKQQIIATKTHLVSDNTDTNLFTDADLAILGKDAKSYEVYTKAIRKEYRIYPNLLYRPGRKKVLEHFLGMDSIYKTITFRDKFEIQARQNISAELDRY